MDMKPLRSALVLALILAASGTLRASEVVVGEPLADVLLDLGKPRGFIRAGSYLLLDYERGKVELRDEKVVQADLMTDEELAAYKELTARRTAMASKAAMERRIALFAEGTKVRDAKLTDPVFLSSPASEQVAFWRWFRQKYPGVEIGGEYAVVLQKYEAELDAQQREADQKQQVAELEARVADAERAAAEAQEEAERARQYYGYYSTYPICYVRPSVPCGPTVIRPPVQVPSRPGLSLTWSIGPGPRALPPASTCGTTIGWLAWER